MESFGEALRKAREASGRSLEDLSRTTRIQPRYLEALETETWGELPGGLIGRGFVRSLARELGLSAGELLERYSKARGEEAPEMGRVLPDSRLKVELRSQRKGTRVAVFASLAVVLGLVGWVLWFAWQGTVPEVRTEVPTASEPAPADPTGLESPPPSAAAPAGEPPAASEQLPAGPAPGASPAALPAPEAPALTETGVARKQRLELQAVDKAWVRVVTDGRESKTQMLSPGERALYAAQEKFELRLGNAGGVRLSYNGEELKVPGRLGQVVTVTLPQDLESLKP
jgi:cytoskeleton protein RodZ